MNVVRHTVLIFVRARSPHNLGSVWLRVNVGWDGPVSDLRDGAIPFSVWLSRDGTNPFSVWFGDIKRG